MRIAAALAVLMLGCGCENGVGNQDAAPTPDGFVVLPLASGGFRVDRDHDTLGDVHALSDGATTCTYAREPAGNRIRVAFQVGGNGWSVAVDDLLFDLVGAGEVAGVMVEPVVGVEPSVTRVSVSDNHGADGPVAFEEFWPGSTGGASGCWDDSAWLEEPQPQVYAIRSIRLSCRTGTEPDASQAYIGNRAELGAELGQGDITGCTLE